MELRMNIGLSELLRVIKQLPTDQKIKIKMEVEKDLASVSNTQSSNLKDLLLNGPIMTEEEEQNFQEIENQFDQWQKNLSV